jgi:hypothetical protein|tara:strand:+ start:843 stop:1043 length:201 start_codon:yes stop_codon:yes gene_type:complete
MSDTININISLEDLDMVYAALEAHQPKPHDLFGTSTLNIADMGLHQQIREVLFNLKEQDDRWIRAQ